MTCEICTKQAQGWMIDDAYRCEPCAIAHKAQIFARSIAFEQRLVVGDYVGVRYVTQPAKRYGRILAVVVKNGKEAWTPGQRHGNCYGMFRLRMEDGSFREEHPEHLCRADDPNSALWRQHDANRKLSV